MLLLVDEEISVTVEEVEDRGLVITLTIFRVTAGVRANSPKMGVAGRG
jgi:hypothetical protein